MFGLVGLSFVSAMYVVGFVLKLMTAPNDLLPIMLVGLLLGLLWLAVTSLLRQDG